MTQSEKKPLSGTVAVIVGGSRRTGREAAIGLAEDGAHVIVTARSSQGEIDDVVNTIKAAGGSAEALLVDVADEASVQAAFAKIKAAHGRLDILINNAAIRQMSPFLETSLADWRSVMATNLDGVFLCCREGLKIMVEAGNGGTIVNIGGVTGHIGAKKRAHVATAKAGIVGLTKSLALEFAEHAITVNCVVPGKIGGERAKSAGESPLSASAIPLGREGDVTESAAAIRFLCQPVARFMTGQSVHVNGGIYMP